MSYTIHRHLDEGLSYRGPDPPLHQDSLALLVRNRGLLLRRTMSGGRRIIVSNPAGDTSSSIGGPRFSVPYMYMYERMGMTLETHLAIVIELAVFVENYM